MCTSENRCVTRQAVRNFYLRKRVAPYLIVTMSCALVSFIYFQFSHGVTSPHMTFLFIYPLLLGVVVGLFASMSARFKPQSFFSTHLYHTGVVAVILSSLLRGVFEIAGTSSIYENILLIIGIGLLACSTICFIINKITKNHQNRRAYQ